MSGSLEVREIAYPVRVTSVTARTRHGRQVGQGQDGATAHRPVQGSRSPEGASSSSLLSNKTRVQVQVRSARQVTGLTYLRTQRHPFCQYP